MPVKPGAHQGFPHGTSILQGATDPQLLSGDEPYPLGKPSPKP